MEYRQQWLKELLEIQKNLEETGHAFPLIRMEELHAIRQQWLRDPIEPDLLDSLPGIYQEVFGENIEWPTNDSGAFTAPDAELLRELAKKHDVAPEMVMKLIETELSLAGLGKRKGIMKKIESILRQDWDIDDALDYRHQEFKAGSGWRDKITQFQSEVDKTSHRLKALEDTD